MLLALDISLNTGAAWGNEHTPTTALYALPSKDLDRALMILRESVAMLCRRYQFRDVYIEQPLKIRNKKHGAQSELVLTSLAAVAREAAYRHGARARMIPVQSWRADVLGDGSLSTEEAKRLAQIHCQRMRWNFRGDHNVAEACCIWYYGMAKEYPKWHPQGKMLVG